MNQKLQQELILIQEKLRTKAKLESHRIDRNEEVEGWKTMGLLLNF
jgi:hypothetical protein